MNNLLIRNVGVVNGQGAEIFLDGVALSVKAISINAAFGQETQVTLVLTNITINVEQPVDAAPKALDG